MDTLNPPGRISKTNKNTYMIIYAAILTKDKNPYDLNKTFPPKSSLKQNLTVSYDINTTHEFSNTINTTKKNERTLEAMGTVIDTPITAPITNEENISTLLDENNKTAQANINKIITENNESNKLTFLQMLENNNKQIKLDILETLKTTIEENNKSILNKNRHKWKQCS